MLCGAANLGRSRLSAGSLRLAIRRFLPQEAFPSGIVCRSCKRASDRTNAPGLRRRPPIRFEAAEGHEMAFIPKDEHRGLGILGIERDRIVNALQRVGGGRTGIRHGG